MTHRKREIIGLRNERVGHTLTTTTPLLDSARYWLTNGANPAATITTTSGPGHYALRSTISHAASLTVMGDRFQKAK